MPISGYSVRSHFLCFLALIAASSAIEADDWPMWGRDPARRASSDEQLAETLHLQWYLKLAEPRPAWPSNQEKLRFDDMYDPVLAGKTLFVPSMVADNVTAYDTETGAERWRFYVGGPVRFAPVVWSGRVYFTSDDGYLYCVDAGDGSLIWKFLGGPSERKLLGNDRLVSAWPARGAPVLSDGKIYFAASIWPFMGTFIHALDAETGAVIWTNSGSGSDFIVQQHGSPAFSGIAPQGYMAITEGRLVVSGGRTVPAVYDLETGRFLHYNVSTRKMGSKGGGGYGVAAGKEFYFNGGSMYVLANGKFIANVSAAVLSDYSFIGVEGDEIRGFRPTMERHIDRKGDPKEKVVVEPRWTARIDEKVQQVFLKSGTRLYCSGAGGRILAVDLPQFDRGAQVSWSVVVPDEPLGMISGDGKLFVSTNRGRIYCFSGKTSDLEFPHSVRDPLVTKGADWKYLDDGSDQGTAWRAAEFDDAAWPSGPAQLGYGDDDELTEIQFGEDEKKKHITYYFRREFNVPTGFKCDSLKLDALVDDGAVVYLNGHEVARFRMPDGEIKHVTAAAGGPEKEGTYETVELSAEHLTPRTNVVAVEVHQRAPESSDVSFELQLLPVNPSDGTEGVVNRIEQPEDAFRARVGAILRQSGARSGYAVALGLDTGRLVEELVAQSGLHVIVLDPDPTKVDVFRRRMDDLGLYGTRVCAVVGEPQATILPQYCADLVVSENALAIRLDSDDTVSWVFDLLRPYSGAMCFSLSSEEHESLARRIEAMQLDGGEVERSGRLSLLRRVDAPSGSADWTHQYGNAANTVVSDESVVKAPLGLLWFGGPSNAPVLPRHGHGPTPQVVGGRLFIEGRDLLRSVDIYTGRLLWERELKDLGEFYDNKTHEPGANTIGSNYASARDGIYVVYKRKCLRLDPATGDTISEFVLPIPSGQKEPPDWGYIGLWRDVLIGGEVAPGYAQQEITSVGDRKDDALKKALGWIETWKDFEAVERKKDQADLSFLIDNFNQLLLSDGMVDKIPEDRKKAAREKKDSKVGELEGRLAKYLEEPGTKRTDYDARALKRHLLAAYYGIPDYDNRGAGLFNSQKRVGSRRLVAMDRYTGRVLWEFATEQRIRNNAIAIGGGTVFCIDRVPRTRHEFFARRGLTLNAREQVVAIDLRTGDIVWSNSDNVFGTFLSYSEKYDVLLQAGSRASDRARDEVGKGMVAYDGSSGEVLWKSEREYSGPCLLLGDSVITQGYGEPGFALDIMTGQVRKRPHPISGVMSQWQYGRNYGCNTVIGSKNLLTFRSAAAGYFDLVGDGGTGNLGGFRTGCTSNLIPAGGILNAPDYTRTCTCSYQQQSSLALVHMPEVEMWTFNRFDFDERPVRRLGLNFGAPGDRRAPDGTLWLDWPSVGGKSPDIPIVANVEGVTYRRQHSSRLEPSQLSWVGASALEGEAEFTFHLVPPPTSVVPNEVEGKSPLRTKNATFTRTVPVERVPGTGANNSSALKKGWLPGPLEGVIPGYEDLAAPSVTVEFWTYVDHDFDYVDARSSGKEKLHGFVIDQRKLRLRYFVANEKGDDNEKEVTIETKDEHKIADNEWVHVAFCYDAPTGVGALYKNGVKIGEHDGPDGRALWWDAKKPDFVVANGADGMILMDELRIANRALPPQEFLLSKESPEKIEGVVGAWRMNVPADGLVEEEDYPLRSYTVRLVFAELEAVAAGQRPFDVDLQDARVLEDFDIVKVAGGPGRVVIHEVQDVKVRDRLRLKLTARGEKEPILNGIQVIQQGEGRND